LRAVVFPVPVGPSSKTFGPRKVRLVESLDGTTPVVKGRVVLVGVLMVVSVEVKFGFPVEDCSVARLQGGMEVVEEEAPAVPPAGGGHRHPGRPGIGGVLEGMPPGLPHPGLAALG